MTDPVRAKLSERMRALVEYDDAATPQSDYDYALLGCADEVSALEARLAAAEGVEERMRAAAKRWGEKPYGGAYADGVVATATCYADELSAILKGSSVEPDLKGEGK